MDVPLTAWQHRRVGVADWSMAGLFGRAGGYVRTGLFRLFLLHGRTPDQAEAHCRKRRNQNYVFHELQN